MGAAVVPTGTVGAAVVAAGTVGAAVVAPAGTVGAAVVAPAGKEGAAVPPVGAPGVVGAIVGDKVGVGCRLDRILLGRKPSGKGPRTRLVLMRAGRVTAPRP